MATCVLIHGAASDSWYWHRVVPGLRALGHEVVAPDLPCDDDSAGFPQYADAVVKAVGARRDLILIAQSLGGFTAPLVCKRLPVDLLVLVAAMVWMAGTFARWRTPASSLPGWSDFASRRTPMPKHATGTRKQWLDARVELLKAEKEHTRRGDALTQQRMALPWVRLDKQYRFETDDGPASLADLFGGRSQLMMYHFMFGPDYTAGCPACSAIADGFNGCVAHWQNHDVAFTAVSRAPLEKLQAYKKRMGWTFPWASSFGSDFNPDFNVYFTEQQQVEGGIEYNYVREPPDPGIVSGKAPEGAKMFAASSGTDVAAYTRERPGMSAFALEDGVVYHTYSAFARGLDAMWCMYQWLDRAPLGRHEEGLWFRRHDEY